MRRAAAVLLALVAAGALAPAVLAHGTTVRGTVTDAAGDPVAGAVVLVQPADSTAIEDASDGGPASLLALAEDPPIGLRTNRTTADGTFVVHLPGQGRYDVVAVTPGGASRVRTVTVSLRTAEVDLVLDGTAGAGTAGPSDGTGPSDGAAPTPTRLRVQTATPAGGGPGLPLPAGVAVLLVGVAVAAYAVGRTGLPWVGRNAR